MYGKYTESFKRNKEKLFRMPVTTPFFAFCFYTIFFPQIASCQTTLLEQWSQKNWRPAPYGFLMLFFLLRLMKDDLFKSLKMKGNYPFLSVANQKLEAKFSRHFMSFISNCSKQVRKSMHKFYFTIHAVTMPPKEVCSSGSYSSNL